MHHPTSYHVSAKETNQISYTIPAIFLLDPNAGLLSKFANDESEHEDESSPDEPNGSMDEDDDDIGDPKLVGNN